MGRPRLPLQELLESITENVYFQTPTNIKLKYPCIVYERDDTWSVAANNQPYANMIRYQVTVIDHAPDSELADAVEALPYCKFDRHFSADNLNHHVFTLFF